MSPIAEMTKGHWHILLPILGIDRKYLTNNHGPCPICGGSDRFRWDNKWDMGGYICSQCGAGNGFDLVMKVTGKNFREIALQISSVLGKSKVTYSSNNTYNTDDALKTMRSVWDSASTPDPNGPVAHYLTRRIGMLWKSPFLKEHLNLWCDNQQHIAMLWKIVTHNDIAINIHKTYLTQDGHKSSVDRPKRVMQGTLPEGCAIRTGPPMEVMGVAEGVESALSASIMHKIPVWACVNGTMLSKWVPPKTAQHILVFADNDSNYAGQSKAYILANRLEVQFKRKVSVYVPPVVGSDYNDIHREAIKNNGGAPYIKLIQ